MKIAWLFSALAFPIFALNRAYASAPPAKNVNKAEALRSFFEKSGAILPKPSGSAVNNDDILNEAMLGWISIKVYAHLEMEDTPKAVSESTFSCFRINFKKDPAAAILDGSRAHERLGFEAKINWRDMVAVRDASQGSGG